MVKSIQRATFTGTGDKDKVPKLYKDYVDKIASMLVKTLSLLPASFAAKEDAAALLPLPAVSAPPASPLRLAAGQLVLMLPEGDASACRCWWRGRYALWRGQRGWPRVAHHSGRRGRAFIRRVRAGSAAVVSRQRQQRMGRGAAARRARAACAIRRERVA